MIDARVRAAPDGPQRAQALERIGHLLELLESQEGEISEAGALRADTEALQSALKKKTLNRERIEGLIQAITAGAGGISALGHAAGARHGPGMKLLT